MKGIFYLSVPMYLVICISVGHILLHSLIKVMTVSHGKIRNGHPCSIALVNADTLLPMMFLGLRKLGTICCGHKMFRLNKIRNIFVPRTQNLWPQEMLRARANGETFVSATMCRRLPGPLRPWQTRTHCCGHIVADTNVSPFARARNICCGHKFCVRDTKNVSDFVQKHFVSATNVS